MSLKTSISGIRGTVGGEPGKGLTPVDILKYVRLFGQWVGRDKRVIVARGDARLSGEHISRMTCATLSLMGIHVTDIGLSSTPSAAMRVGDDETMDAGIVITASHNAAEWNALKCLNERGECLSSGQMQKMLSGSLAQTDFPTYQRLGRYETEPGGHFEIHIRRVLDLDLTLGEKIRARRFKVVVDGCASSGGLLLPKLLEGLGVEEIERIDAQPTGMFVRSPEPVPENLKKLCQRVRETGSDLGLATDPDVDRIAFVDEMGQCLGEEYSLVIAADHVLSHQKGAPVVSNLSSTEALGVIAQQHGVEHLRSSVGEAHVVEKMKQVGAVVGGEGNGGVIYGPLHYGRDALVGTAFLLSLLAERKTSLSQLRGQYPDYVMYKHSLPLASEKEAETLLRGLRKTHPQRITHEEDGLRLLFPSGWAHIRASNTEPILRICAESRTLEEAKKLALGLLP